MAAVEDLKNELYTLDSSQWSVNLENILRMLSFPVRLIYTCNKDEFMYEYSGKLSSLNGKDRRALSDCDEIAEYKMERRYKKIHVFSIRISGNENLRNEKIYDIYKLFVKLYGRFTILVAVFNGEMSFVGLNVDHQKHAEVIISEWFGYNNECEKINNMSEIDFSLFHSRHLARFYQEYVGAIAREYIKYPESKMYLIYGCDNPITYEFYAETERSNEEVRITAIDRDGTFEFNSRYFPSMYGWDYFVDDRNVEIEVDDFVIDEEDSEFEWTMLEMELAAEESEESYNDDEEYYFNNDEDDDYDEEIIGLNPEEMLEYIRNM